MTTQGPLLVPDLFGSLRGVRILSSGSLAAPSFAAALAAEQGAEVILVEPPGGDVAGRSAGLGLPMRDGEGSVGATWIQERRNLFHVTLDLSTPDARELFLELVRVSDIWMEGSGSEAGEAWSLDDEAALAANPRLVLARVSGYGRHGDPAYVAREANDMTAQAFGGVMNLTGFPEPGKPTRVVPSTADYVTALTVLWSSLAAYVHARRTGRGQSIDLPRFECVHHLLGGTMVEYFARGAVRRRSGNRATAFQPSDTFAAKDGWVIVAAVGTVFDRILPVIGLDATDPRWKAAHTDLDSIAGIEFDALLRGWIAERPVTTVVEAMNRARVACCPVMDARDMAENAQYRAREVHVEWEDEQVGRVRGIGALPRFSVTPGRIWRGSVPAGHDNDLVFGRLLGRSVHEIDELRARGVLCAETPPIARKGKRANSEPRGDELDRGGLREWLRSGARFGERNRHHGGTDMTNAKDARLVPEAFGPLQGVRILSSGTLIAQPFAAALAAEQGAEVIQIERPGVGDAAWRNLGMKLPTKDGKGAVGTSWIQERRNTFHVTLDLSKAEGRELFLELARVSDVWMESSKPGSYPGFGLDDAAVLGVNPRLVIAHVSGYGQSGDPAYLGRASYDMIGQAFGGLMSQTGFPDPETPTRAAPWTADYITALTVLWSCLAGYIHAQRTGQGQVVDVSQFESIHHTLGGTMIEYFEKGAVRQRSGNRATAFQPYDAFAASDGWVVVAAVGNVYERVLGVIGLDPADPKWSEAQTNLESVPGIEFDALLRGWVAERTVAEVVEEMNRAQVACCPIMTAKDMGEDAHYRAREVHVEWEDEQVGRVKGVGVLPRFSSTPGKIWRGSVPVGHDNDRVFGTLLGLGEDRLARLREKGVL